MVENPRYALAFDYKAGSLIVNAVDPFSGEVIWRSSIDTKITPGMPLEEKKKHIVGSIKVLLRSYPAMVYS